VERGRPERAFNVGATLGILVTVAAVIFVLQNRQSTGFDWHRPSAETEHRRGEAGSIP
jgi:hypothetical protein